MILVIYDSTKLNDVIEKYSEYSINSIISAHAICEDISKLNEYDFNKQGFDISNYVNDTNVNRYYKTFLEKYILELSKHNDDIFFLLNNNQKTAFFALYPYLFEDEDIEEWLEEKDNTGGKVKQIVKNTLTTYVYNEIDDVEVFRNEKSVIVSFSSIIDDFNGININFNFDGLDKEKVYYLNINSFIKQFDLRKDMIFTYELILNKLSAYENIFLLLNEKLLEEAKKHYPYNFIFVNLDYVKKEAVSEAEPIYLNKIDELQAGFDVNLIGHNQFKNDLYEKLLTFKYLNEINKRYIFSIFLCGASGIGKTEVGRQIHKVLFGDEPFIKINFGNYSSEGTLNCLIGSPPGYIGSNEDSELVKKIKRSKSKVIVFDEFERADPSVYNFFYELLEDGRFTDRFGKVYNMNQYIIIFTSNLSKDQYNKFIPKPLRSRFDMRYIFDNLSNKNKIEFKKKHIQSLLSEFNLIYGTVRIDDSEIIIDESELCSYENIRDIKSLIENTIVKVLRKKLSDNMK